MIATPTPAPPAPARVATAAALQAYASACPLFATPTLTYAAARRHASGDALADFLVIELTEGAAGDNESARLQRAAQQVEYAIGSLEHVAAQLRARAISASSLPLALCGEAEPVLAGAGVADAW